MKMEVTKIFTFDMAHNLPDHKGLCNNLHGHTYRLEVTLSGEINKSTGMVRDFGYIKDRVKTLIVDVLDHSCVIYRKGDFEKELIDLLRKHKKKVLVCPYAPTAENMAKDILEYLRYMRLPVTKVRLYETPTSFAEVKYDEI